MNVFTVQRYKKISNTQKLLTDILKVKRAY
jgi:hypothetical protein